MGGWTIQDLVDKGCIQTDLNIEVMGKQRSIVGPYIERP